MSLDGPIVAEDIEQTEWLNADHRRAHAAEGTRSMMALPLRYGERVVGTLVFYYREPRTFSEAEKSTASLLANLAAAAIGTAELYQAQRRLAEDQRFVARASELLASSLDYETTLANLATLAVPQFADWCAIDMVAEDGTIERLTVAHVDPEKVRWAHDLAERYPPDPQAQYGVPNVIRTRQPELFTDIPPELLLEATAETPELYDILQELGLKSSMCVPLVARDRALGAITFVSAESGRRYQEPDLGTAQDLARRAAISVDNARLFREAEQSRHQAQESLAVVDAVFAAAPVGLAFMDTEYRYVRVNEALAALNGHPVDEHFGRTLREVLGDELADEIEPFHRQVLETGEPILDLDIERAMPGAPERCTPLAGQLLPGPRRRRPQDRRRGRDHGRLRAGAGARGCRAAGARLAVLAEASQTLASTLDYESTLASLANLLVPRFADWYAVDILDDDGLFRRLAVVHSDPAKSEWAEKSRDLYPPDLGEAEGTGRAARTGEAVLYRTISDELLASSTKDAAHYEILHELGMASAMVVPLTAAGRTFGGLMLVSSDPARLYSEDDLEFAKHLGRRAAVAVDNARLYRAAEERARAAVVVQHVADGVLLVDRERDHQALESGRRGDHGSRRGGHGRQEHDGGVLAVGDDRRPRRTRRTAPADSAARDQRPGALAVDHRRRLRRRDRLRVPRPHRGAGGREAEVGLRLDGLARAAHATRRDLRRRADAPARGRSARRAAAQRPAGGDRERVRPAGADRERHPLGEPARVGGMQTTIEKLRRPSRSRAASSTRRGTTSRPTSSSTIKAPKEAPPVAADPDKARQVLTNLVDNAVKYSPDGGKVSVEVAVEGSQLRYSVRDEGLGVPPAEHRRIFEKFYRLDPNLTRGVGGTGLGLYISRELLERMGGRIWVESSGSGGSTFFAELPIAAA